LTAVISNEIREVKALLQQKDNSGKGIFDLNEKQVNGKLLLRIALEYEHYEVTKVLLSHGAKINAQDKYGGLNSYLKNPKIHRMVYTSIQTKI